MTKKQSQKGGSQGKKGNLPAKKRGALDEGDITYLARVFGQKKNSSLAKMNRCTRAEFASQAAEILSIPALRDAVQRVPGLRAKVSRDTEKEELILRIIKAALA